MSKQTHLTNLVVNAQANALGALADGGFVDIYDGDQPVDGDDELTGQTLGVTLALGSPAFAPAALGIITANPIASALIMNDIVAKWGRVYRADHATKVMDISVGVSDANLIVRTTTFVRGVLLSCSGFTHTVAKKTIGA